LFGLRLSGGLTFVEYFVSLLSQAHATVCVSGGNRNISSTAMIPSNRRVFCEHAGKALAKFVETCVLR
jgi:hypothetical protein